MTDKRQDDELEQPVSDETVEGEGQSESWQDDLPPEDDFNDMDEPLGEEPVEEAVAEEGESQAVDDKKRGKKVLFTVLAVAAALVGGMAYLQLGSGQPEMEAPPLTAMLDVKNAQEAKPETTQGSLPAPVTPKTGEADISSLYKAAQMQTQGSNTATALPNAGASEKEGDKGALGASTEIMGLTDAAEQAAPATAAAPAPSPVMAPPPATPAPEVAKVETIPVPELQPQPVAPVKAAPAPLAAKDFAAPASPDVEAKLKEMNAQIDQLKAALDTALQKLEMAKKSGGGDMEDRLAQLEKKLAAQKAEQTSSIAIQEPSGLKEELAAPAAPVEKEIKAPAKKTMKAKKPTVKTPAAKKTAKSSSKAGKWVLRAATPEAAWVSQGGDYAAELRRVAVGETLPGIGKIEEIRQKGDVWEVVGSSGVLK